MSLVVDTSVWSLAVRRDVPPDCREVGKLREALEEGEDILLIGVILQEVLQGCRHPEQNRRLRIYFAPFSLLAHSREDFEDAAELRNACRRKGVQVGTVDALIAATCMSRHLPLLSTDAGFRRIADHYPLALV